MPSKRKPRSKAAPKKSGGTGKARRTPPKARQADPRGERLQKVLAAAGIGSRRECETLIEEGRVDVDGEIVATLGSRVHPESQRIRVDGEQLPAPERVYFAVHKPSGILSTAKDPEGRARVVDLLPPTVGRVYNVGRLDKGSEGLIIVTNDGEFADLLTHPRYEIPKTYHVKVAGQMRREEVQRLTEGVHLAEGFAKATSARIKRKYARATMLEMVLNEGRNREIRRLLAASGHKVMQLVRVAIGPVRLSDLPAGAYRPLTAREISSLRRAVNTSSSDKGSRPGKRKTTWKKHR